MLQVYEEFMANIPRDKNGKPAAGIAALKILHEPGYVEMRNAEAQDVEDFSRTKDLATGGKKRPLLGGKRSEDRPGWSSDTEYKHKRPTSKVVRRSHSKPTRRGF